ncbi:MAG: hypothetical protein Q4P08_02620 [Eubacteriales bacterium]|nr:hypothetical protein [Eubacteriales bacterium]
MTLKQNDDRAQFYQQLKAGTVPHAILLSGAEAGQVLAVGKEFAAALLCAEASLEGACGSCLRCQLFQEGNQPDFKFLDKAEDRLIKVERIRSEVIADLYISPQFGTRKVYLICADELNEQGQNILLKSLEEPPEGVYFILPAVEKARLLPTVLSRLAEYHIMPSTNASAELTGAGDIDFTRLRNLFFGLVSFTRADLLLEGLDYLLGERENIDKYLRELQDLLRDLAFALSDPQFLADDLTVIDEYERTKALANRMRENSETAINCLSDSLKASLELEQALAVNSSLEVSLGQYLLALRRNLAKAVKSDEIDK